MIDDQNLQGTGFGRQFQSQLGLHRGDDRRRGCRGGGCFCVALSRFRAGIVAKATRKPGTAVLGWT
jgi:hypothetical protein